MFDVINKRRWFFALSFLMTIPGLVFILLTPLTGGAAGLKFTIDYTGGTRWVIRFANPDVPAPAVREALARLGLEATVASQPATGFLEIKTIPIGLSTPPPATPVPTIASPSGSPAASGSPAPSSSVAPSGSPSPSAAPSPSASPAPPAGNTTLPTEGRLGEVAKALQDEFGPIAEQQSLTTIGPVVSNDLVNQALLLILVGSVGILVWITYRFRDVKFGTTALVALLHDVILVIGVFAILGTFFNVEVDALFVTAMLTIIGFSVHDTIVVFDRVRENKARHAGEPFAEIVNHSILQTIGRSITTSFTVFITLLALLLFGGAATTHFVLALIIGITAGTYSSVFFAAPLLVEWQEWEDRKRGRLVASRSPRRATS
ncbi:MAG TPA: protein translocase subunit SecF [Candidatus Limnocylindrales bacterium]|nr:protein translocase subunit SecF [Candidatus Limnocylindrales bacterium]